MPARTAEIELAFLERSREGIYEFAINYSNHRERFDRLIEALTMFSYRYGLKVIYYTSGSGHYRHGKGYQINEDGMWLLSHLFSNWTEMYERVSSRNKHSPHRKCFTCDTELENAWWRCDVCRETFCQDCSTGHTHAYDWRKRQEEQRAQETAREDIHLFFCEGCGEPCTERYDCLHCGKHLCHACHSAHSARTNPYTRFTGQRESASTSNSSHAKSNFEWTFNTGAFSSQEAWETLFSAFFKNGSGNASSGTRQQYSTSSVPYATQAAFKELGIAPTRDIEKIRQAFRMKVKASATGDGGYKGDMDKLTKAKEAALQYAEAK